MSGRIWIPWDVDKLITLKEKVPNDLKYLDVGYDVKHDLLST